MSSTHYLISLIIPLGSLLLQSYPRLFNKYFGVDVWTRLLEIEHVKKTHHRIPGRIKKGFIIEGYFDYPIIFPWLFSFFPKKFLLKIERFVSPFFDALQNILLFFIAYSLTGNLYIALISQLVYSLIPIIPIENSYLTPRSLGYFNFTLAFYPLLTYHMFGNPVLLIIGLLFTTTLFLTHRFALQSFLFICIFFSIIDKTPLYILSFISGFIIATLVTKGHYLRVAKGHLANIYFWVLNYKYRFAHQIYADKKEREVDWVGKIYALLSSMPPIFILATNVWAGSAFLYLYLYYFYQIATPQKEMLFKMSLWVLFFYVVGSIVLKVKRLIPIGEGQRYLEMATVPSSILSAVLFFHFYTHYGLIIIILFILVLVANFTLILFTQIKGIVADKNRSLTPDLKKAFNFINKLKGPEAPRIMCIPHQITTMTVYNTKADILVNADNQGLMQLREIYPILKRSISFLQKKYSLGYLLLRESFVKLEDLHLKNPKIIFKSGDVLLIKL